MKLKIGIVILISIIILNHCKKSSEQDISTEVIKIDEQQSANIRFNFKKTSAVIDDILYPHIAVSDVHDKIIIYGSSLDKNDKTKMVAKTFDKDFNFNGEKAFYYGLGPGDAGAYNIVTIEKDKIFISENSNFRVSIYDNNWNLLTVVRHKLQIDAFELYDNANFFISRGITAMNDKPFIQYSIVSFPGFEAKPVFSHLHPTRKTSAGIDVMILGGISEISTFYNNKNFFMLVCSNYQVLKFDLTGKKLKDITAKVDEQKTDHSLDDKYLEDRRLLKYKNRFVICDTVNPAACAIPLMKGFLVVRRNDYSNDCSGFSDADYFSYKLEYLGKVKCPCFLNIFFLMAGRNNPAFKYSNGFLYLVQEKDEKYYIEKWEIIE